VGLPPPARSLSHNSSTSAWDSHETKSEIAGVKVNCGPPFRGDEPLAGQFEGDVHDGALRAGAAFAPPGDVRHARSPERRTL
jgi:hypothetical protein